MTLGEFLDLSVEGCYEVNIFYNETGKEVLHQVEIGNIEEELENINLGKLMYETVSSWDIGYYSNDNKEELCINVG